MHSSMRVAHPPERVWMRSRLVAGHWTIGAYRGRGRQETIRPLRPKRKTYVPGQVQRLWAVHGRIGRRNVTTTRRTEQAHLYLRTRALESRHKGCHSASAAELRFLSALPSATIKLPAQPVREGEANKISHASASPMCQRTRLMKRRRIVSRY